MSSTKEIREAVTAWGRARWPDCRVLYELVFGTRRADVIFVTTADVIAVEIKSATDRLDRLAAQVREYSFYCPEVWIAIAAKWQDHQEVDSVSYRTNVLVYKEGEVVERRPGEKPHRDELSVARLIELLWKSETFKIAERTDLVGGRPQSNLRSAHVKKLIARLLTGNEILREVCAELRSRPLVGLGSDSAQARVVTTATASSLRNLRRKEILI